MDAFVSQDERRAADERNRVVLISRRWDQVSNDEFEATEANKPGLRGERV